MRFFRRIMMGGSKRRGSERRTAPRFAVSSGFLIKAILNAAGRDLKGQLLTAKGGGGWDRPATVTDLSWSGAHLRVPHRIEPQRDDPCSVKLDLEGYRLELPGRIARVHRTGEEVDFGIAFELVEETQRRAYDQLFDLVALGAGLQPAGPATPEPNGLIRERHEGVAASHL